MKINGKLLAGLIFILILLAGSLKADTVFLKSGHIVAGSIIAQTRTTLTVRTTKGQVRQVPKAQVRRVKYGVTIDPEKERQKRLAILRKQREKEQKKQQRLAGMNHLDKSVEEASVEIRSVRKEDVLYERNQALWRSAIIPGWGHFYLDEYEKSLSLFALTAASYSFFTYNYTEFKKAESAYNSAVTPPLFTAAFGANGVPVTIYYFDILKTEARERERNLNLVSIFAAGLWLYSIADVWYNHDQNFELSFRLTAPELAMSMNRQNFQEEGFTFALQQRF